jgi:hypothetical protein
MRDDLQRVGERKTAGLPEVLSEALPLHEPHRNVSRPLAVRLVS